MTETTAARRDGLTSSAVTAASLGRRFGRLWALHDCSFSVPAGSVVALVGANGAGKTTLMNLVSGVLRPTAGSLTVGGARDGDGRSRVRYVAQDKPLYAGFTAAEMMSFGRRMNTAWDADRAERWLHGYAVPRDRKCGQLSGGQRAQVALALAIGACPDVLLLDEPLANLDPLVRSDVVRRLLDLVAETGMTVMLSTHVIAELHGVADRLLVLAGGRLVLEGDVDDLLAAHRYATGPAEWPLPADLAIVRAKGEGRQRVALVRSCQEDRTVVGVTTLPRWTFRPAALDELVLEYLSLHATPAPEPRETADA